MYNVCDDAVWRCQRVPLSWFDLGFRARSFSLSLFLFFWAFSLLQSILFCQVFFFSK